MAMESNETKIIIPELQGVSFFYESTTVVVPEISKLVEI